MAIVVHREFFSPDEGMVNISQRAQIVYTPTNQYFEVYYDNLNRLPVVECVTYAGPASSEVISTSWFTLWSQESARLTYRDVFAGLEIDVEPLVLDHPASGTMAEMLATFVDERILFQASAGLPELEEQAEPTEQTEQTQSEVSPTECDLKEPDLAPPGTGYGDLEGSLWT